MRMDDFWRLVGSLDGVATSVRDGLLVGRYRGRMLPARSPQPRWSYGAPSTYATCWCGSPRAPSRSHLGWPGT